MATRPGEEFSLWKEIAGRRVTVSGEKNGQAIVVATGEEEFFVIGYRCRLSVDAEEFAWPGIRNLEVESGRFEGGRWQGEAASVYTVNQTARTLAVGLADPVAVRISW